MLYESELVKNPNFILQSLRDMSCLDLNFSNQIARENARKAGEDKLSQSDAEDIGATRVNKIVKNNHSLAFPNAVNTRFHSFSDDSLYDL